MIDNDPRLAELLERITGRSHVAYRQVDMFEWDGSLIVEGLPVVGGEITASLGLLGRFTGWLQVPALPDLVPYNAYQVTSVGLGYLDCWAGVVESGVAKKVRVARVYVDSVTTDYPDQTVRLGVRGLMNRVTTSLTPDEGTISAAYSITQGIEDILNVALDWMPTPINLTVDGVTDKTYPANSGWSFGQSRADLIDQWAEYLGGYVYATRDGDWVLTTDPVAPAIDGLIVHSGDRLVRVTTTQNREDLVSKVALRFTPAPGITAADVYGTAAADAGSGDVTLCETRTGTPSSGNANAAAATLLARHTAQGRRVDLEVVPYPCLEPGDTIRLVYPPGYATYGRPEEELLLIREVTYPWSLDQPMRLSCTAAPPEYGP